MQFNHAKLLAVALALLSIASRPAIAAPQASAPAPTPQTEDSTARPKPPDDRPLPDVPTLLRDINKNQHALEDLRKLYTCHLSETEDKLDSHGQVKFTTVQEYDVFYVGDEEVRHLLAKDGKPLDGREKKKADAKFDKEFDEQKKRQAKLASDSKKQAKRAQEEEAQLSDFLRAERFTNARRELYRGKEVIAFDFSGNQDYKAKKLIDRIIQKVSGVMWVDEEAREIVRLEARFDDAAKIGGGLVASLHKGSNFVFEQEKINEEVWMPSYMEVHVDARVFVMNLRENAVDRYSEYKKFRTGSALGASQPAPDADPAPKSKPPAN